MDDENHTVALKGYLGNGITGWLSNITDEERHQSINFMENPVNVDSLIFNPEKIINCPVLAIRIKRIIEKYGIQAIDIINELLWGLTEDGKNTPIDSKKAIDLSVFLRRKMKGGKKE